MTNKQARSSCKPQILPCIHASTLDVLTNSFGKLDHHPVAEIQSRHTAYNRIHATSSSAFFPTSPTRRGLGDATTWHLHSEPHPHGSSTPIRIKHNRDLHGSKSACMQANKEEVCVHTCMCGPTIDRCGTCMCTRTYGIKHASATPHLPHRTTSFL